MAENENGQEKTEQPLGEKAAGCQAQGAGTPFP